jgi:NAD(P)-dependent dehydrogenase (short-subunit alcohol dehydrogenase family)
MTNNVWFITGAGRGMGLDIAKAALAAGHKVVATGRNTDKVAQVIGESANPESHATRCPYGALSGRPPSNPWARASNAPSARPGAPCSIIASAR